MRIIISVLFFLLFLPGFALSSGSTLGAAQESSGIKDYLYEPITMEKLSRLYWALSYLDINKDENIDNFLRINECDIYRDYYNNEFEWAGIRKAGREFIKKSKSSFSLRFEAMQPVQLDEYDFERKGFQVEDGFQINGVRRFEIMADDAYEKICGSKRDLPGYPRGVVVEFSRPLIFDFLPMEEEKAKAYVKKKQARLDKAKASEQEDPNISLYRDAYLVIKMKFFSYVENTTLKGSSGTIVASLLGNLEGIEIYADEDKKDLLYREDYRRKRKPSEAENRLRKEYAERKKKQQLEAQKKAAQEKAAEKKPAANP